MTVSCSDVNLSLGSTKILKISKFKKVHTCKPELPALISCTSGEFVVKLLSDTSISCDDISLFLGCTKSTKVYNKHTIKPELIAMISYTSGKVVIVMPYKVIIGYKHCLQWYKLISRSRKKSETHIKSSKGPYLHKMQTRIL